MASKFTVSRRALLRMSAFTVAGLIREADTVPVWQVPKGMVLTDYSAPQNISMPSRAGLLTGRYPIRAGLGRGVILQKDPRRIAIT